MASFNRVILMGNITRDIELRYTNGGDGVAVCDIGLAINDKVKRNGEWCDDVTFIDVTLWGRTAEVAAEYLGKGSPVFIEGRLKLDSWQTNDGQKRSKLKVVGERLQMLGKPKETPQKPPERPPEREFAPWEKDAIRDQATKMKEELADVDDSEIPF